MRSWCKERFASLFNTSDTHYLSFSYLVRRPLESFQTLYDVQREIHLKHKNIYIIQKLCNFFFICNREQNYLEMSFWIKSDWFSFKGQCQEFFCFMIFSWNIFPSAPFRIVSRCTSDISDTHGHIFPDFLHQVTSVANFKDTRSMLSIHLKGAQAWDIRERVFYINQTCTERWLGDWRKKNEFSLVGVFIIRFSQRISY